MDWPWYHLRRANSVHDDRCALMAVTHRACHASALQRRPELHVKTLGLSGRARPDRLPAPRRRRAHPSTGVRRR